jgi:coenzyme F420-reducing hydrogenase beta subunit
VTDSFHACVFSILFKKRFFVLERFAKNTEDSMNSRIYDLLKLFKLKDRLIDKNTDLSKIDYEKSIIPDYVGWEKQKAESWIYLDKSLKLHPKSELAIKHKMPKGYIIKSKDEQVVNNSSSGGVFYHLAKWVIMNDGVVFGAVIDNQGLIKHSAATTMDALEPMMSSKYVQSEMGNCFKEALDYLKQGIPVLFSGTPCQVRGFYNFIGDRSKYDKLYLIDFVCHGVPSPKVWKLYLDEVLKGSKVYRISFRDKTFGWNKFSLRITRENKKTHLKNKERDAFILGFLNNLYLRPSCYKCKVKGIERRSDVTLADAWHITEIDPTIKDDDKGISTVFIHTDEGEELLHQIEDEVHIHQIDAEKLLEMNQNAILCPIIPKNRTDFFKHISNQSGNQKIEKIIQKNLNISKISKIKKTIKKVIR